MIVYSSPSLLALDNCPIILGIGAGNLGNRGLSSRKIIPTERSDYYDVFGFNLTTACALGDAYRVGQWRGSRSEIFDESWCPDTLALTPTYVITLATKATSGVSKPRNTSQNAIKYPPQSHTRSVSVLHGLTRAAEIFLQRIYH